MFKRIQWIVDEFTLKRVYKNHDFDVIFDYTLSFIKHYGVMIS